MTDDNVLLTWPAAGTGLETCYVEAERALQRSGGKDIWKGSRTMSVSREGGELRLREKERIKAKPREEGTCPCSATCQLEEH